MNLGQLQHLAKHGGPKKFKVVGPVGEKTGIWLDAWAGFLQFDGSEGFMMVRDFIMLNDLEWFPIEDGNEKKHE